MLKFKKTLIGNLRLGNPGTMNITVVNDDREKWVREKREYLGVECHAIHVYIWG